MSNPLQSASRTDIRNFQSWLKTLPKQQTQFLYQSYLKEECRQANLIELFSQYQSASLSTSLKSINTY